MKTISQYSPIAITPIFLKIISILIHAKNFTNYCENDLQQVNQYASKFPPFSHIKDYNDGASNCEIDQVFIRVLRCAQMVSDFVFNDLAAESKPLWDRTSTAEVGKVSCTYNVLQQMTLLPHSAFRNDFIGLHIRIIQSECSSVLEESKGGSSFEVVMQGNRLVNCDVIDRFDDSYDVFCPSRQEVYSVILFSMDTVESPYSSTSSDSTFEKINEEFFLNGCANVTITLDYEHFDAFAFQGNNFLPEKSWTLLRHTIIENKNVCIDWGHKRELENIIETARSDTNTRVDHFFGGNNFTEHLNQNLSVSSMSAGGWYRNYNYSYPAQPQTIKSIFRAPANVDGVEDISQ